jgi:hypothetical protein
MRFSAAILIKIPNAFFTGEIIERYSGNSQTRLLQDGYTDFQRHGYRTGVSLIGPSTKKIRLADRYLTTTLVIKM